MGLKQTIKGMLPASAIRAVRRVKATLRRSPAPTSARYEILPAAPSHSATAGWITPDVAARQFAAFTPLLAELEQGRPRADFAALADAFRATQATAPSVLELGCGSGWNFRVLQRLGGTPFHYTGLDCSAPMLDIARRTFPEASFTLGDACRTPFRDAACDILLSGTVLMHLPDYHAALRESRRLTRRWCLFHTVPVLASRPTTFLRKHAYSSPVLEVIFNEPELLRLFATHGLTLRHTFESIPYDLSALLGEPTRTRTYLCEVSP